MSRTEGTTQSANDRATQAAGRRSLWQPRDASVAQSVAQYSLFVSRMKIALPVAAGVLLLLIILLPLLRGEDERFHLSGTLSHDADTGGLSMTNARYYGTDDKGQPYTVTAQDVHQQPGNDRAVSLRLPKAEITLRSGTWLSATANAGTYNRDSQQLELQGDVSLYQYQGNEMHTPTAHVELKSGAASGNDHVTGQGPLGAIEAAGFTFSNTDKVLHFHGPAHLTINPKAPKSDNTSPTAQPPAAPPPASTKP